MSIKAYTAYAVPARNLGPLFVALNRLAPPVMAERLQYVADEFVRGLTSRQMYDGPPFEGDIRDNLGGYLAHIDRHKEHVRHAQLEQITLSEWWDAVDDLTGRNPVRERKRYWLTPDVGERLHPSTVIETIHATQEVYSRSMETMERSVFGDATLRVDVFSGATANRLLLRPVGERLSNDYDDSVWGQMLGSEEAKALGVVDWSFWDSSDRDEDVPARQWAARRRDWNAAESIGVSWSAKVPQTFEMRDFLTIDEGALPLVVADKTEE